MAETLDPFQALIELVLTQEEVRALLALLLTAPESDRLQPEHLERLARQILGLAIRNKD